ALRLRLDRHVYVLACGFFFRAFSELLLRTPLRLLALLFLSLHFLLTLLECDGHIVSLKWRWAPAIQEMLLWRLPTRFARLSCRFAIILIRESTALSSTPTASWRP